MDGREAVVYGLHLDWAIRGGVLLRDATHGFHIGASNCVAIGIYEALGGVGIVADWELPPA